MPALNVAGASQENWANVILYDYTGDDNCVWWLEGPFCDGSDYLNVTNHNLIFNRKDGFYRCSRCKYVVSSPEKQDSTILSREDYLTVIAAQFCYSQYLLLADKTTLFKEEEIDHANACLELINNVRTKTIYKGKYDYQDYNGYCYCEPIECNTVAFSKYSTVNWLNLPVYNGTTDFAISLVIGYYCPPLAAIMDISSFISGEMSILDFGALTADYLGKTKTAYALSALSTVATILEEDIRIGDAVIGISIELDEIFIIFDDNNIPKKVLWMEDANIQRQQPAID